jgi:hypothetical protein
MGHATGYIEAPLDVERRHAGQDDGEQVEAELPRRAAHLVPVAVGGGVETEPEPRSSSSVRSESHPGATIRR